ncbi:uncharacterized protein [Fopius arisanus]|uniref:Uncharacterized protein isoform X2 n=1 Tax=Fopius arisanus TaxID=64838 RepID=A0A9R1TEX9_9HYME|nr:PREDICTED: uncharacterized protein LOC105269498 isoform X2 [Fopius arisanus]
MEENDVPDVSAYDPTNEAKACFRRLLSGKRIVDPYIKRVMECERLHDCHRMCEYERGFTCEGFNYRSHAGAKGMCELSSTPPTQVDVNRDFISDPRYDYYERDWTRRRCERRRDKVQPDSRDWWGESDGRRPVWTPRGSAGSGHYIPPVTPAPPGGTGPLPYGGTFMGRTKLTLDYDRSQPDPWFRSTVLVRPTHPPPLPVRPLEDSWPTFPQRHETYGFHQRDRDRTPIPGVGYPRYLPSRPSDHGYSGNGYSYGRPGDGIWMTGRRYGQNYPIRRIGPDPVTNEISHYVPDRRKPSKPDPAEGYGPSYGDGYPDHSGHPKPSPRPLHLEPPHSKAPPGHDSQYGPFHNYGGAYGYDRPAVPRVPPTPPSRRACSVRSAGGFRLAKGIIRKSYLTANLGQCESLCQSQKEFTCLTFAYRYNLAATSPSDNCLLSDAPLENLIFYTDLEPDRDYDIYAIMINPKWCETRGRPSSSPRRTRPPDECFWRVRTGFGMPPAVVKKPTRVEGMGECQVQCVHARDFTCRSFVFRYDSSVSGLPNCYLSDWPAVEIDPHKMLDMEGAELYERGSFGRGCEPHHPIPSPDPTTPSRPALDYKPSHTDEASCYAGYDRPCKLTPYAIILTAKVDSEADCRRRCTVMRENVGRNSAPCMSFSYKISGDDIEDNCHMSDVPTRDLRPGLDYTHDEEYSLYVFKELEPKCVPSNEYSSKPYADPEDPYYYEVTPLDTSKPGESDLGYHYPMPHDRPSNPQDERFFYPPELMVFNHYTVNGHPCKRGTKCERHPVAGFWSCQTEGSEPDSWEYCCEPSHQCGFSQGSSYPWCYVGGSRDQWRPCSERYFPYSSKSRPPRPGGPSSKCHYEVDCEGRHWPVAVLHGEAPPSHNWEISQGPAPNGTDSVALANTHDHRGLNDSEEVIPSVKAIEDSKNSTNSTTSGVKKRRSEGVLFPLRSLPQEKAPESFQRPNSRFRPLPISNSSQNGTQFFITRRLNAALSTQESEKSRSRGTVAKIERIERPTEGGNDVQRLVTVSSKSRAAQHDLKIRVPVISVLVSNSTTVRPNSRHWVKMETIGRNDSSV